MLRSAVKNIRAEGDDDIRRQLEELNREKGNLHRKMDEFERKYGTSQVELLRAALDELVAMWELNEELDDQMGDLFAEAPDINESDFENY